MLETLQRSLMLGALRVLPQNALSRLAGRVAGLRLPQPLQRWEIGAFGRAFGVDFGEVRDPLDSFPTLQAFFTRALTAGARPIDPADEAFVSPCDGAFGATGEIRQGTLLQAKGRPYSIGALLGDDSEAAAYEGGTFATFYLSPRDYHRFHMPCAGRIRRSVYLPGRLWPVNRAGVEGVDSLFAQNERICAHVELPSGALCLVAVGATNVGKVKLTFDSLTTNVRGAERTERAYGAPQHTLEKGEQWGHFEFGSTIVVVASPGLLELDAAVPGTPVVLGRRIGTLLSG